MPADALYWNSVDFDSDESITNTFPRNYVDPWDLENYAYIREHLDSLEVSSEPSSFGEPVEATSSFYYAPVKSKSYSPVEKKKYDTLLESEYGTAKYAEIEDVYGEKPVRQRPRQRVSDIKKPHVEDIYGIATFGLESDEEEIPYKVNNRSFSTTFYEGVPSQPAVALKRRMSYSYGDYGYNNHYNSPQSIYGRLETGRRAESVRPTPIYDDVGINKLKPNFGLSNYGHLQIDYSWSWNNLNKYIYN